MFQAPKSILWGSCYKWFIVTVTVKMIDSLCLQSVNYNLQQRSMVVVNYALDVINDCVHQTSWFDFDMPIVKLTIRREIKLQNE